MKERPILFSALMVRAILAGTKTQTRRLVKPQPNADGISTDSEPIEYGFAWRGSDGGIWPCPYGAPGDRLWVRETFAPGYFDDGRPAYRADWTGESADVVPEPRWTPSIYMLREDSRIDLEVTAVRVERLHEITDHDVIAEGVGCAKIQHGGKSGRGPLIDGFAKLWDRINGKRAPWANNPLVWVVSFRRVRP